LRFLAKVAALSHLNSMNVGNLATVFGPNILRYKDDKKVSKDQLIVYNATVNVIAFMIDHESVLFTVSFL